MFLIVGLGNPGRQYEATRHNVGFELVDEIAARHAFRGPKQESKAEVFRGHIGSTEVMLAKPMTFMNLSGDAVGALARYYKVELARIVVAHDDLDFEPGVLRIKVGGGAGGHNGLKSIASHLGADFIRVRIGVGKPPSAERGADFVLSRFGAVERRLVDEALDVAVDAIEVIIAEGAAAAMNRFNRR